MLRQAAKIAFVGVLVGIVFLAYLGYDFLNTPAATVVPLKSILLEVRRGQSIGEIARILQAQDLILSSEKFIQLGRILKNWKKMKAGEYQINSQMSPLHIWKVISSGISVTYPLTIREGQNIYEVASMFEQKNLGPKEKFIKLFKDKKFIALLQLHPTHWDVRSLEGYLFPETYHFSKIQPPEDMVRYILKNFHGHWGARETERSEQLGFTKHQLIILASIIEKETGAAFERPLISSVFHNRIRKKMRLQSDPTTIYGIWESFQGNLRKIDLLEVTDYNTYQLDGLPAGPISNPGKEAIQAALYPAQSSYFYFVSKNDGTHQFSGTFEEHTLAVKKLQLNPKARAGKSWRNLKKSPRD